VLDGIAAAVSKDQVSALLLARAPQLLDSETEESTLFEETVRGIATEVIPLAGANPDPGPRHDLAVWCITLGTAAQLEAALFPEQQGPGDLGRAAFLERRYLRALAQLQAIPLGENGEDGATPALGPVGDFPPAERFPDPADPRRRC